MLSDSLSASLMCIWQSDTGRFARTGAVKWHYSKSSAIEVGLKNEVIAEELENTYLVKWSQKTEQPTYFFSPSKRSVEYSEPDDQFSIKYKQSRDLDKRVAVLFEHSFIFRTERENEEVTLMMFQKTALLLKFKLFD